MTTITDPRIERYLMGLQSEADPLLGAMERKARAAGFPIVDRLVGRLLFILTKLKNPRLVVELGSGFGYSAYWFARALSRGMVVLTDRDGGNIASARGTFRKAGLEGRAVFREGEAVSIARHYNDIDILFIDLDKRHYTAAIKTLLPNLARNALVIADNSLWYGRVAGGARDRDTAAIREFNRYMMSRKDFFTTVVPLRDGVLVSYRLA